jgi:hypothetical protein
MAKCSEVLLPLGSFEKSGVCTVVGRSSTENGGLNLTRGMYGCLSAFFLSCAMLRRQRRSSGSIRRPSNRTKCLKRFGLSEVTSIFEQAKE